MYKEIKQCRICGNSNLTSILHLGTQFLTGVFPKKKDSPVTSGPVELVKCHEDQEGKFCGLLQLRQSYDLNEMYGENYGYRSGLNQSMVEHLHNKVKKILESVSLQKDDIVIDIGSNDSTLLKFYPDKGLQLVGIDPSGKKFKEFYPSHIQLIADFFSKSNFQKLFGNKKAKIVTSISMFYDIERPLEFMKEVYEILDDEGVWIFEQSYMPTMLEMNAYDTVCHEHLEYYGLKQIKWMTDHVGFKICDIAFNDINGGSFSLMVAKKDSSFKENKDLTEKILAEEEQKGLRTLKPYQEFAKRVFIHRDQFRLFLKNLREEKKKIIGYGASTKGNVVLQFCNLTTEDISCIAEVNQDKFGCFTPGTHIPIVSEKEARAIAPEYMVVFPWHFKKNFLKKEKDFLEKGGKLVMPLPEVEIIEAKSSHD